MEFQIQFSCLNTVFCSHKNLEFCYFWHENSKLSWFLKGETSKIISFLATKFKIFSLFEKKWVFQLKINFCLIVLILQGFLRTLDKSCWWSRIAVQSIEFGYRDLKKKYQKYSPQTKQSLCQLLPSACFSSAK